MLELPSWWENFLARKTAQGKSDGACLAPEVLEWVPCPHKMVSFFIVCHLQNLGFPHVRCQENNPEAQKAMDYHFRNTRHEHRCSISI